MSKIRILFLIFFLAIPNALLQAEGKNSVSLVLPQELLPSLESQYEGFASARKKYHDALVRGRSLAVSNGKLEEVKKIDEALQGNVVEEFESFGPKSAKRSFDFSLERISKSVISILSKETKKVMGSEGGVDKAQQIQNIIQEIMVAQDNSGGEKKHYVTVYANKDFMPVPNLIIERGQVVKLYSTGTWSPSPRHTKADANTYNVSIRAPDNQKINKFGKSYTFTATRTGELAFKMANYGKRFDRTLAQGTMRVTIVLESNLRKRSLESVLAEILKEAPASSVKKTDVAKTAGTPVGNLEKATTVTVHGNRNWQDVGVEVQRGDRVTISAEGKWTTMQLQGHGVAEKKKRPKRRPAKELGDMKSPDELNLQVKIGDRVHGNGGSSWSFQAKSSGMLSMRMMGYEVLKEVASPGGKLSVSISVR